MRQFLATRCRIVDIVRLTFFLSFRHSRIVKGRQFPLPEFTIFLNPLSRKTISSLFTPTPDANICDVVGDECWCWCVGVVVGDVVVVVGDVVDDEGIDVDDGVLISFNRRRFSSRCCISSLRLQNC